MKRNPLNKRNSRYEIYCNDTCNTVIFSNTLRIIRELKKHYLNEKSIIYDFEEEKMFTCNKGIVLEVTQNN